MKKHLAFLEVALPLILLLFGFPALRHAEAAVVPEAAGEYWDVHFAAHKDNVGLEVFTECYKGSKLTYRSLDSYDVEPYKTSVLVRRSGPLPKGSTCTIEFDVRRNRDHDGNPNNEVSGESARLTFNP